MKAKLFVLMTVLTLLGTLGVRAQGTAFTYQGRLDDGPNPANGLFDFSFSVWSAAGGPAQVGETLTNNAVAVSNGLFTVALDFGAAVFTGEARWLEIGVRTNGGGAFTTLSPRQALLPTPYAIHAGGIADGAVTSAKLAAGAVTSATILDGTIVDADIAASAAIADTKLATIVTAGKVANAATSATSANTANAIVARDASGNFAAGTVTATAFSGSGAGLNSLNADNLSTGTVPDARLAANVARTDQVWALGGNGGTSPGTHFLGTTDNQALELKVDGQRALRFEPNTNGAPNVVGGCELNFVGGGAVGATIGGGGATNYLPGGAYSNRVEADFTTIGGGRGNMIGTYSRWATIGGGDHNTVSTNAVRAAIGGGSLNHIAAAYDATIAGGWVNTIIAADSAFIGGGTGNQIDWQSRYAVIGGGWENQIQSNGWYNSIGGGYGNTISIGATSGVISGGARNTNSAPYATIPGGDQNLAAGRFSFAAGQRAKANHFGTFVWADGQAADFASTGNNQFLIRAGGGVGIGKANPSTALDVNGTVTAASFLGSGAGLTSLDGGSLTAGSVGNAALANDAVTSAKILNGSITSADIADGTITSADIADGTITGADILDGTITSAEIANGTVATVDLADAAVTSAKIQDGTVTSADIASGAVATAELANAAVTSAKLASDSASLNKVSGGTMTSSSGQIGIGTSSPSHVLHVNSSSSTSVLRLTGPGSFGSGAALNFGDGDYVYLREVSDDILRLQANQMGMGRTPAANRLEVEGNASKTAAGDWLANSDRRIKTDITTVTNALDTLGKVRLVSFRYTDAYRAAHPSLENRPYLNVVAQEFQQVFPDYVKSSGDSLNAAGEILQVDSYPLTIYSAAAIQELNCKVDERETLLRAENAELKERLAALEQLVKSLTTQLSGNTQ